jgi:hypothetical protein
MLQKVFIILCLLAVEYSTFNVYFSDFKDKIEANDENEDTAEVINLDKFFVVNNYFQFQPVSFIIKNTLKELVSPAILQPFKRIDSPPPQQLLA